MPYKLIRMNFTEHFLVNGTFVKHFATKNGHNFLCCCNTKYKTCVLKDMADEPASWGIKPGCGKYMGQMHWHSWYNTNMYCLVSITDLPYEWSATDIQDLPAVSPHTKNG